MNQNRNKLIDLFIGNISNTIVHKILEKAIDDKDIRKHYLDELEISFNIAKRYREKINPVNKELPEKDMNYIKDKIIRNVKTELELRISKGYENINLKLIEPIVDEILKEIKVI